MNATIHDLASTLESVDCAEQAATEAATRRGFGEEESGAIGLAVREAAANAVLHGNRFDAAKRVTMSVESTLEGLTIAVRDEGAGFDPAAIPDPLAQENLLKSSGRGVYLIRSLMDEVRFCEASPGTEIVMTKFFRRPDGEVKREPASV